MMFMFLNLIILYLNYNKFQMGNTCMSCHNVCRYADGREHSEFILGESELESVERRINT